MGPNFKMHPTVFRLSLVSFFNDWSSEALTRLIPLYLVIGVGASHTSIGALEAAAVLATSLLKPWIGAKSDRSQIRKLWVSFGYGVSAGSRLLASWTGVGIWPIVTMKLIDRTGKSLRSGPRDAWIADVSSAKNRGHHFGVNRSFDTWGAVVGLVSAVGLLALLDSSSAHLLGQSSAPGSADSWAEPRTWSLMVILLSLPGFIALLIALFTRETTLALAKSDPLGSRLSERGSDSKPQAPIIEQARNRPIMRLLAIYGIFGIANSSDAFLILQAKSYGLTTIQILLALVALNMISAISSAPLARLSDRLGRKSVLGAGWLIYGAVYLYVGYGPSLFGFFLAIAAYGLFYGFTEGVEKAWIADLVPHENRGRIYGWLSTLTAATAIPANLGFGYVSDRWNPQTAFIGAGLVALSALLLLIRFQGPKHEVPHHTCP